LILEAWTSSAKSGDANICEVMIIRSLIPSPAPGRPKYQSSSYVAVFASGVD
jgi:hypothetical protein